MTDVDGADVALVVAADHRQGSVDARRIGDDWTVRLAFGAEEAVGALTDDVDVVVIDAEIGEEAAEEVATAAHGRDAPVVAISHGGEPPTWADDSVSRPLVAGGFASTLADLRS